MNIWTYWDKPETQPAYIDLCFESMLRNCGSKHSLHILSDASINVWLPDLRKDLDRIRLKDGVPQPNNKGDYIKGKLLVEHGGLWLDADTIVLRPLDEVARKLMRHKIISRINESKGLCVNFLGAKRRCKYMRQYADEQDAELDAEDMVLVRGGHAFATGKITRMWKESENPDNEFYIFDREIAPLYSKEWKTFFKGAEIYSQYIKENTLTVMLYQRLFPKEFLHMSKEEILKQDWLISEIFRRILA
jgi:hypothetical protein